MDYSPHVIVAKLADRGEYIASESSFYKILKENKMLTHRGKSKVANRYKPAPLVAYGANEIWSWDITYLKTLVRGQFYYVYLMMDIWSRKIVGFDVHEEESMENSSILMDKLCKNEGIKKDQLVLHSDNGGPMKGATMLATLERLGVAASFSRPRVSNDNPYSESLFKTLKYCPKYPERFENLAEAKKWMIKFMDWYNNHQHSSIKFVTPNERHLGLDIKILNNRKEVYEVAKNKNPERWNNRNTRNWDREEKVYLNYLQKSKEVAINMAS
jgi:transposase InsO family protein